MLHACMHTMCVLRALKTLRSDSANSWTPFEGTFCNMGPELAHCGSIKRARQ